MFKRLFFHNCHDAQSHQLLNELLEDLQKKIEEEPPEEESIIDIDVIDVFNGGVIPENITISQLPYLIDKHITLETEPPFTVGIVALSFSCRDYGGNVVENEEGLFHLFIGEGIYDISPESGIMSVEINCPVPHKLTLRIEGDGYWPFETEIEVVENDDQN